jgi:hypothetical protein
MRLSIALLRRYAKVSWDFSPGAKGLTQEVTRLLAEEGEQQTLADLLGWATLIIFHGCDFKDVFFLVHKTPGLEICWIMGSSRPGTAGFLLLFMSSSCIKVLASRLVWAL